MRYVWYRDQWVPAPKMPPRPAVFPGIIRDTMDPIRSMADGQMYDSKSAIRRGYKEHGYEELGNDAPRENALYRSDPHIGDDIAQAWEMLEQGYQPPPTDTIGSGDFADVETRII